MARDVRMPDGTIIRNVPDGTPRAEVEAKWRKAQSANKPTSFGQGVVEGVLRPAMNAGRVLAQTNPVLNALNALGVPNLFDAGEKQTRAALDRAPKRGSTAGNITGEILGTLPTAFLPGSGALAALGQGAAGGAMLSDIRNPRDVLANAGAGAAGGLLGQQVGKRVLAPIAERVGRTKAARSVATKLADATSRATGRNVRPLPAPLNQTERVTSRALPKDLAPVRQNLDDAARLGLPYSLADADPKLHQIAGSVTRFSPDGRALAEQNFGARAMGQADRAVNAIDQYLAPITDIEQRAAQITQDARNMSRPLYDEAFARAAPVDENLSALLQSPAGKSALAKAREIAMNEGRDPNAMGFDLNEQGEVILRSAPSFETLDLVKRGLDSHLNDFRNQLTGKLELTGNPLAGSVEGLRQRLVGQLDDINPAYQQARAAYQAEIARRTALENGGDMARNAIPQRQFDAALTNLNETTMPEAQRGYATAMADKVNSQRLATNPYNAVYGSPLQQSKVASLFPDGADDFNRTYALENDMAQTARETLGGSPTQARNMADQLFQNDLANGAVDAGVQLMTGGGVPGAGQVMKAMAPGIRDRMKLGLIAPQKKADALAPVLFDTNPNAINELLNEMARRQAEQEVRRKAYQRTMGLLGTPSAALGVGFSQ